MNRLYAPLLLACLLPAAAKGATIESVAKDSKSVTLSLTKDEMSSLSVGDQIKIQTRAGKDPTIGKILSIRQGQAIVEVTVEKGALKKGRSVAVASSAQLAPLSVAPAPADTVTSPPPSAPASEALDVPQDNGFQTQFFHQGFASAAQLYQVRALRTDFTMGLDTENYKAKSAATSGQINISGPTVGAGVAARAGHTSIRYGLIVGRGQWDGRVKLGKSQKISMSRLNIAPGLSFAINPRVAAGLSYDITQTRYSGEIYDATHNISYAQPKPAVIYHDGGLEAGLTFSPKVYEQSRVHKGATTSTVLDAQGAVLTAHGEGRLPGAMRAFGRLEHHQNRMINVGFEHGWKNNVLAMAGVAKKIDDQMTVDGSLHATTPAYAKDSEKSADNIAQYGMAANLEQRQNDRIRWGAGFEYTRASDSFTPENGTEKVEIEHDTLRLTVAGAVEI